MPGFGKGRFGQDPFGDWNWAQQVFFKTIPEFYRNDDTDGLLEAYSAGTSQSFTDLRLKIRDFEALRAAYEVRTQYDEVERIQLGERIVDRGEVEQFGVQASADGTGALVTVRGRFAFSDVGKEIIVDGSTNALNNRTVVIASVVDAKTVVVDPPLQTDAGPLTWEIRASVASDASVIRIEVLGGDLSKITPGWLLSDGLADFEVLARTQFKLETDERKLLTQREGTDGTLNGSGNFVSLTADFTQRDVGRWVSFTGANDYHNEGLFEIVEVLSASEAVVQDSSEFVVPQTGPFHWAIRRHGEICVAGPAVPLGIVEQSGSRLTVDSSVAGTATVTAPGGGFETEDLGKLLTIRADSNANNGVYEVTAINGLQSVDIDTGTDTLTTGGTEFLWELRSATAVDTGTDVEVRAQSLIQFLAPDYGVEIDTREDEVYQRRWTDSPARWIGIKGHEDSYAYIAALTGYTATASPLYKLSAGNLADVTSAGGTTYLVGETGTGRYGTDGSLTQVGFDYLFSAPTAVFSAIDVGKNIHIQDATDSANDGVWAIEDFVDATTVVISTPGGTIPDASNGALTWSVVVIYTDLPPLRPVYDEINEDLASEEADVLGGSWVWSPDRFCWDPDLVLAFGTGSKALATSAVDPVISSPVPITYTVWGTGDWQVAEGTGVGRWQFTVAAEDFFLQTVPELVNAVPTSIAASGNLPTGSDGAFAEIVAGVEYDLTSAGADFVTDGVVAGMHVRITGSGSGNDGVYRIVDVAATALELCGTCLPGVYPDANSGSLSYEVLMNQWTTQSTTPPSVGSATLTYICAEILGCDYCKSNKVLIEAQTSEDTEGQVQRLRDRLEEVTPAHAEIVESFGVIATASATVTVTVTTP